MNSAEKTSSAKFGGRDKRDIQNIFVNPRAQLKYAFVFFGGGVGIMCLYIIYFLYDLNFTIESLANTFAIAPEVAHDLNRAILTASAALLTFAASLTLIMFAAGIALSHRIFGPMVPIQRLVQDLIKGDYKSRGSLRKRDEWQDLMKDLNTLADGLEKKNGKS
jgi:HAMP domain-containing protein